jgi:hypothetical protein
LLLEWEEPKPPSDLVEGELVLEEREMSVDEALHGLSDMITLLGQMQTLRMASGKTDIPDDERALGKSISRSSTNLSRQHRHDLADPYRQPLHSPQIAHLPITPRRI